MSELKRIADRITDRIFASSASDTDKVWLRERLVTMLRIAALNSPTPTPAPTGERSAVGFEPDRPARRPWVSALDECWCVCVDTGVCWQKMADNPYCPVCHPEMNAGFGPQGPPPPCGECGRLGWHRKDCVTGQAQRNG